MTDVDPPMPATMPMMQRATSIDIGAIAVSWFVTALPLEDLSSFAEFNDIHVPDIEASLGISEADPTGPAMLRMALCNLLATSSPDVATEWLQQHLRNLRNGMRSPASSAVRESPVSSTAPTPVDIELPHFTVEDRECMACYGMYRPSQITNLGDCEHMCCFPCAIQTVRGEMSKGVITLQCPFCPAATAGAGVGAGAEAGRTGKLTYEAVTALHKWSHRRDITMPDGVRAFSDEELERFNSLLVSLTFAESSGEKAVACPNPACAKIIIAPKDGVAVETPCPHCKQTMCQSCGLSWHPRHPGKTCAQVEDAIRTEAAFSEIDSGAVAGSFKPCPGCGNGISKFRAHGCHHITCGRCSNQFCIVCMGTWPCANKCGTFCNETCDCPDCDACKPGSPCGQCSNTSGRSVQASHSSCCSCAGESRANKAKRLQALRRAQEQKMSREDWCGPRRKRDGPLCLVEAPAAVEGSQAREESRRVRPSGPAPPDLRRRVEREEGSPLGRTLFRGDGARSPVPPRRQHRVEGGGFVTARAAASRAVSSVPRGERSAGRTALLPATVELPVDAGFELIAPLDDAPPLRRPAPPMQQPALAAVVAEVHPSSSTATAVRGATSNVFSHLISIFTRDPTLESVPSATDATPSTRS